jgi:hypothetical protein
LQHNVTHLFVLQQQKFGIGVRTQFYSANSVQSWSEDDVINWLRQIGLGQFETEFRRSRINGTALATLDDAMLSGMGIKPLIKVRIQKELESIGIVVVSLVCSLAFSCPQLSNFSYFRSAQAHRQQFPLEFRHQAVQLI